MDLLGHIASRNSFLEKMRSVDDSLMVLSKSVSEKIAPPTGPYLLFHHISSLLQRSRELKLLIERLYNNRIELLRQDTIVELAMPTTIPGMVPFPNEYQELVQLSTKIDEQIRLDFQTMLIFTGIALDEWAHVAAYISGGENPKKSDFRKFLKDDKSSPFDQHSATMLWLDAFSRLYRNKMIVHREEPWQISHSRNTHLLDWQFWTPISPGWLNADQIKEYEEQINQFLNAKGLASRPIIQQSIYELLTRLFLFTETERKTIYDLAETLGFETPTFQTYAHQLADFLTGSLHTLLEVAQMNPEKINIGVSPHL